MKALQISAILLTTFAVAACGGSDSPKTKPSGGQSTSSTQNNGSSTNSGNTNGGNTNSGNTNGSASTGTDSVQGKIFTLKGDSSLTQTNVKKSSDLNVLEVDGQKIVIVPTGISGNIVSIKEGNTGISRNVGGNMSYSRFGMITLSKQSTDYLFEQGLPTTDMPTDGIATYKGAAIYGSKKINDPLSGQSSFTVDFGKKTVNGTVSGTGFSSVSLSANISGNRFSGKSGDYTTDGGFYGPKAAEMAGVFTNGKDESGAFGAKKQ